MIQYVVVPAVQAHSAAWLNENTRTAVDVTRNWVSIVQQWARRFADFLVRLSEMRFEQCTRKFLCSLGRVSARQARQEKRSAGARMIEMVNNLFSLPMLEGRMDRVYLDARHLGASGADCENGLGKEQCPVHSSIMETLIHQLRDLF